MDSINQNLEIAEPCQYSLDSSCLCLSSLIETIICQVLQPHHISSQGQKVRDPSLPTEKSAEHKDVAVSTLLPESWYSDALDSRPCLAWPGPQQQGSFNLFVFGRDEGRSGRSTSSCPPCSCWRFLFQSSFVLRSVASSAAQLIGSVCFPENVLTQFKCIFLSSNISANS